MSRAFAIVPAAGNSVRMGQPKLLMHLAGKPILAHTLASWQASRVKAILVVVQSAASPLVPLVQGAAGDDARIELVVAESPPPDMKASVQAALRELAARHFPRESDAFLIAPADIPQLPANVIDRLIEVHCRAPGAILSPTVAGERTHPALFPWSFAAAIHSLAATEGVDAIMDRGETRPIAVDELVGGLAAPFQDVDTPAEFAALARQFPPS